ncbi:unnamed protein product [Caenorhabditis angaria]|uniref:Uncharacterized protein n=1 Tax=Caenorhabditis angaria TaxID=860376 RepID=A0A9P1I9Z7_9PELO|nr:unnamed protein product [Caenorhabditis angaria]
MMIEKRIICFVLQYSFLILNIFLINNIWTICGKGKVANEKEEKSNASSASSSRPAQKRKDSKKAKLAEKPAASGAVTPTQNPSPEGPVVVATTPTSHPNPLLVEQTQPDSVKFPARVEPAKIEGKPHQKQQKTLSQVQEISPFVIAGEKTGNKEDFDDYLNNLGG